MVVEHFSAQHQTMGIPSSVAAIRVLVVDDSLAFREAVHELIDSTDGFAWAGETCSGEDAVKETLLLRPDLVLMDVRMPGIGGIAAAARIASQAVPPVVILITGADPPAGVPDATAAEIIPKQQLSRELLTRVWEDHGPQRGPVGLLSEPVLDLAGRRNATGRRAGRDVADRGRMYRGTLRR